MNEFKETVSLEKNREIDRPGMKETDVPKLPTDIDSRDMTFRDSSDIFDAAFKKFGFSEDTAEKNSDADDESDNKDYSDYIEKGEDGKYYDKETGKAYDSIEAWLKAQESLAKRYESVAEFFETKAKKEWARFKNSEKNGETDAEKWEHYRRSQEYYAKAKDCREKAEKIREKIGKNNDASSDGEQDDTTKE